MFRLSLQRSPWSHRKWASLVVAILLGCAYIYYAYDLWFVPGQSRTLSAYSTADVPSDMAQIVPLLYKPLLYPITAPSFTTLEGKVYHIPGEPRFLQPLGRKLLILDVDTRPFNGRGEVMNGSRIEFNHISPHTAGMLTHYMFAMIHGYDYKFIQLPNYSDRWGTWVKVSMIKEALKTHDFVVFMDGDAVFHYPHLPVEWLFNLWGLTKQTLVAMAMDPNKDFKMDSQGRVLLNTGFIIAQQSGRTQEMFEAWESCPQDTRYVNCSKWTNQWAHEQSAFGNYVRYDFNQPEDIKSLPCAEANGYPEASDTGCGGDFVRHYWLAKKLTIKALQDSVMQYFVPRLHEQFHDNLANLVINAKDKKFPVTMGELDVR